MRKLSLYRSAFLCVVLVVAFTVTADRMASADEALWSYEVQRGDTLRLIAERYLDNPDAWQELQKVNRIADPNRLKPGTTLRIPPSARNQSLSFAEIARVEGAARRIRGKDVAELKQGDKIRTGDVVETGAKSTLTVHFPDKSKMLIAQNSRVVMASLVSNRKTGNFEIRVMIEKGDVESTVTPQKGGVPKYEIKTPALNLAVRGTTFRVIVDGQTGITRSMVTEGRVVAVAQGREVILLAGNGTVAAPGARPAEPTALLAAPALDQAEARQDIVPLRFSWQPVTGAVQYRMQLFDSPDRDRLLYDLVSVDTAIRWGTLPDGEYQLRICAIDPQGLEGKSSLLPFTLKARPEAPIVHTPLDRSIVSGTKVFFRWARPIGVVSYYRIQVSDKADFSRLVAQVKQLPANSSGITLNLPGGKYFWRVASINKDSGLGPYSAALEFELKAAPEPSGAAAVTAEQLRFQWKAAGSGENYQFQASRDPLFQSFILDTTLSVPQAAIAQSGTAPYYLRIKRISDGGVTGSFEAVQKFDYITPK